MADDSQDKFNEPGYKKDVARIKGFFSSSDASAPKTRYRYNQPKEASTETSSKEKSPISYSNTGPTKSTSTDTASTPTKSEYGSKSTSGFGKAFAEARKAGNKDFEFEGKKYAAVTKDEVSKSGSKNLSEYLTKNKSTSEPDLTAARETDKSWSSGVNTQEPTGDTTKIAVAAPDSSDIFSGVKRMLGLKKGGVSKMQEIESGGKKSADQDYEYGHDNKMFDRAGTEADYEEVFKKAKGGMSVEEYAHAQKNPHGKNKYKDGGDIHVTKGHDYIKDLL
jgi:hypothetical protein